MFFASKKTHFLLILEQLAQKNKWQEMRLDTTGLKYGICFAKAYKLLKF